MATTINQQKTQDIIGQMMSLPTHKRLNYQVQNVESNAANKGTITATRTARKMIWVQDYDAFAKLTQNLAYTKALWLGNAGWVSIEATKKITFLVTLLSSWNTFKPTHFILPMGIGNPYGLLLDVAQESSICLTPVAIEMSDWECQLANNQIVALRNWLIINQIYQHQIH